jgi:hypothetical protein
MNRDGLWVRVEDLDYIVDNVRADNRGRVNLGTEFAGKTVSVYVYEEGNDE